MLSSVETFPDGARNSVTETASESQRTSVNIEIRSGRTGDLDNIIALDAKNTGLEKPDYWHETFARFDGRDDRFFLVAESVSLGAEPNRANFLGFIAGEIRAWEFGSPPCGWILTIGVDPEFRVNGIGTRLFDALCAAMKSTGVSTVRTMLARDDRLNMAFFRSQGLMAGSFIELEKSIDGDRVSDG